MQLPDVFLALGEQSFGKLMNSVSLGKLRTYQLFDRLKTRAHLAKLNAEALHKASPRLWAFGLGPHACPSGRLGHDMAECMVAVALEMLPGLEIDTRGGECDDEPHPILSGPSRLRLCWRGA